MANYEVFSCLLRAKRWAILLLPYSIVPVAPEDYPQRRPSHIGGIMTFIGGLIKKIVPSGLKKKLFDMAVDVGMKRLAVWIKSLFSPPSETNPTSPAVTKNKPKQKPKRPSF